MIALISQLLDCFIPRVPLRRYRVMPRRNASAFRREVLAGVVHHLKHVSTRTPHG